MASYVWTGATDTAFATAGNWTPSGPPTTGDTVLFDGRTTRSLAGSNQSAITLAELIITSSVSSAYSIGSTATPLQIGATLLRINGSAPDGTTGSGPSQIAINLGSVQSTIYVLGGSATSSTGIEPVLLEGTNASNAIYVSGGTVGVGTRLPATASTLATVDVSGGLLVLGSNVTLTSATITVRGGTLNSSSRFVTVTQSAGTMVSQGAWGGALTTCTLTGGTFDARHRHGAGVEFTTLNLYGGTLDLTRDPSAVGITTLNIRAGGLRAATQGQVTITTPVIDLEQGTYSLSLSAQQ